MRHVFLGDQLFEQWRAFLQLPPKMPVHGLLRERQSGERIQDNLPYLIHGHFDASHDADSIALRLRRPESWVATALIFSLLAFPGHLVICSSLLMD
jgi:hypothetical protein